MSTLVKMPHCWKSHVAAHMVVVVPIRATINVIFFITKEFMCICARIIAISI